MKSNKLWKKVKPTKAVKDWYKNSYGLEAKSVFLATDTYYKLLEALYKPK